jgi:hypothetical protein
VKKSAIDKLTDRQLLLILTYAPAGLGHLRVTDALYTGLPETVNPVILGSQDKSIQFIHRLVSINPVGRSIFQWLETGPLKIPASWLYRFLIRMNTRVVYDEMSELLTERLDPPEKILVVCTHFSLAHKLAAIKERLQSQVGVLIVVAVFVTDDTFKPIWYIDGADILVVPSQHTKRKYIAFSRHQAKKVRIEVIPYPLNPNLGKKLGSAQIADRTHQLDPKSKNRIHISIPISGAAVGTAYFSGLIAHLRQKSKRFLFHIVSKDAPFTNNFLSQLTGKAWVDVRVAKKDRQVVDLYDELMDKHTLSLEVTKPSEQAFKGLIGTQSRGGVILLFSQPVGSQESDNLDFLLRHSLIPSEETNTQLWKMAGDHARVAAEQRSNLLKGSRSWRGVRIPGEPQAASDFIWWMMTSGIFTQMLKGNLSRKVMDSKSRILGSDGVAEFWELATSI